MRLEVSILPRWATIAVPLAVVLVGGGLVLAPREMFPSYLAGFLFWLGLSLGCLPLLMLHHLTGGRWGFLLRPFLNAGTATLPWMALLLLPVFFGFGHLYPWAGDHAAADPLLRQRAIYLNPVGVIGRAALCFGVWTFLAWRLVWRPVPPGADPGAVRRSLQTTSGVGLVVYFVVASFAVIDWLMALERAWYSSIFPAIVLDGEVVAALALCLLLSLRRRVRSKADEEGIHQIAGLLFAFVMMWAYFSVSQLIIIYAGNLPHEIGWYLRRIQGGWLGVGLFVVAFHFAAPFCLLLFRRIKGSARALVGVTSLVLLAQATAVFWYAAPTFRPVFHVSWSDPLAWVGIGALWTVVFSWNVHRQAAAPAGSPTHEGGATA